MNVEITNLELQSLRNASAWLGLLADRDGDEGGHEGLQTDKRGIDRIISKAERPALPNRKPRTTGRQARKNHGSNLDRSESAPPPNLET